MLPTSQVSIVAIEFVIYHPGPGTPATKAPASFCRASCGLVANAAVSDTPASVLRLRSRKDPVALASPRKILIWQGSQWPRCSTR